MSSVFGFDKPKDSPGFLLWEVSITWQRMIKKALEPYDISHSEFVIMALTLWLTSNRNDVTQVMIVEMSKLDKMTVSKCLRDLFLRGFVQRIEHPKDTRAKSISLTYEGEKLLQILVPLVEGVDANFFSALSFEQQQTLIDIFKEIRYD